MDNDPDLRLRLMADASNIVKEQKRQQWEQGNNSPENEIPALPGPGPTLALPGPTLDTSDNRLSNPEAEGPDNNHRQSSGSDGETTRVGRWMSQGEYDKMISSGKVQMSEDNKVHVANPADINAFGKQAPRGSLYVEFDVPSNTISKGGAEGWGIINGPGSLLDRLYERKELPRITEMPNASNITIEGHK